MISQKFIPFKGLDLDSSNQYISENHSPFLKNINFEQNKNSTGAEGGNVGMFTPLEGNQPFCNGLNLPTGRNFSMGSYPIVEVGQTLVFGWNSRGNHFIYRLKASGCEMINVSRCWNFQLKPEYFIGQGRVAVHVVCRYNKVKDALEKVIFVFFTDGYNPIRFLCVEDMIATGGFTLPYFDTPGQRYQRCDWFNMGVPTPMDCIKITEVPRYPDDETDRQKPNRLSFRGWQFRVKEENVWNQASEHGVISTQYINVSGNNCIENSNALARALKLKFKAGPPTTNKISIEFRNCSGKKRGLSVATDWFLYDTIDCYQNCDNVNWWERQRNNPWKKEYDTQIAAGKTIDEATLIADKKELLKYNAADNTFEYVFAADKQWTPIPVEETNRTENFIPQTAGTLFSIYKNIGTGKHTRGFVPTDCNILNKFSFNVTPPAPVSESCKIKLNKITVWGVIYNAFDESPQPIRKDATNLIFGYADNPKNNPYSYGQVLPKNPDGTNQTGIIACLRGTNHFSISEQYKYNRVTGELVDVGAEWPFSIDPLNIDFNFNNNIYALQKWEFNVLPGTYVFQISSHKSLPSDNYQKTSTFTDGQTEINNPGVLINREREITIDCSAGDVEIKDNPFMIRDLTRGNLLSNASEVVCGYLYEDQIEIKPIEGADVIPSHGSIHCNTTDHNGFYFAYAITSNLYVKLKGKKAGVYDELKKSATTSNTPFSNHFKEEKLYVYENTDKYNDNDRVKIKGKMVLCNNNNVGVAGQLVILTHGAYAITDKNGEFTIIAHDNNVYSADPRIDNLIYSQKGNCQIIRCNNIVLTGISTHFESPNIIQITDDTLPEIFSVFSVGRKIKITSALNEGEYTIKKATITGDTIEIQTEEETIIDGDVSGSFELLGCISTFPIDEITFPAYTGSERIVTVADLIVKIKGLNLRGPQMGGRYQVGPVLFDWLGRHTFVETLEKHIIDIPSLQQTKTYDFSKIGWQLSADIKFDSRYRKLGFYITENLAYEDSITWVAERLQFIDNSGLENNAAPTKIRLYYESLAEYNLKNNLSTTTGWQFLTKENAVIVGDQVEFLANGDGTIFDRSQTALVQYDKNGTYIEIDFTEDLKSLQDGCLIKLIRPKQSEEAQFFYGLCPMIDIIDGRPVLFSGTFNFWDSYLLNRQIPVPIEKKKSKDQYGEEITTDENVNEIRNYPFLFEHHSPSDKWGDHCHTQGWVNTKNIYENIQCHPMQINISKAIANDGIINGLHYFDEADGIDLDENEWGAITAIVAELTYLLVICEHDNLVIGYNDPVLRVGKDGTITAPPDRQGFGRPERKIGNNYGCKLRDINTIVKYNGLVEYVDSTESVLVQHNFSEAKAVSLNGINGWTADKVRNISNSTNKYWHGGIDPKSKKYLLSSFEIKNNYTDYDFANDEHTIDIVRNETMTFDIYTMAFAGFRSYTPEFYAMMGVDKDSLQLITFRNGVAYRHYKTSTPRNNFYGVQCKARIAFVANIENTKEKKYNAVEIYCPQVQFYAYRVTTEAGQLSQIPAGWWIKRETFWCAPFLCDLNTKPDKNRLKETTDNKLLDGDHLYGRWCVVEITTIDADAGKYFEYTASIVHLLPSELSSTTPVAAK